jgi:hypothetical protein
MTTTLTDAERAILTARLAEAQSAYHTLMIGGQAKVYVDQSGERIEYTSSSYQRLAAYIAYLKNQLGIGCGMGPLNVWF